MLVRVRWQIKVGIDEFTKTTIPTENNKKFRGSTALGF